MSASHGANHVVGQDLDDDPKLIDVVDVVVALWSWSDVAGARSRMSAVLCLPVDDPIAVFEECVAHCPNCLARPLSLGVTTLISRLVERGRIVNQV